MFNHLNTQQKRSSRPLAVCAALLGAALLAGGTTFALTNPNGPDQTPATAATPDYKVEHAPVDRNRVPAGSFAPIVEKVAPSVVEVFVTSRTHRQQLSSGDDAASQLRRYFEQRNRGNNNNNDDSETPNATPEHGLGSGVIVSVDGYILTNNHVVKDATEIRVALADGREFEAKVVGTDEKTDVAVIKIQADHLPALTFADSTQVSVGDVVLAIGNPFGIGQTVTQGIVSAKDRVTSGEHDEDFIQTDAAINPGNSGGALVDTEGRLVGINSAIYTRSGGNQGIGFAIPSNICQWVMNSIVKDGHVSRGFLGVSIQSITPQLAHQFKLDRITGALVADVTAGGPADNAGLKSGDVIQQFNGKPVHDASQFKLQVAETAPGTKVTLQVLRDGQTKTLDATLGNFPGQHVASNNRVNGRENQKEALAGVVVADLDAATRSEINVPANIHGAVVTEVRPNSAAHEAGLREGDIITEVNREPVRNAREAVAATDKSTSGQTLVKVWSQGGSHYLTVDDNSAG